MKTLKTIFACLIVIVLSFNSNAQETTSSTKKFKLVKDQSTYTKNVFALPRPGALALGMSFKVKESNWSIGPWAEYLNAKSNANTIAVEGTSLGVLANYTFSKKGAYGIGPTVLFIASIDKSSYASLMGSSLSSNTLLGGVYAGFQYTSKIGLNIWLGYGLLGMAPLNIKKSIVDNEIQDAIDNLDVISKNRLFPFPGIMIGYAF